MIRGIWRPLFYSLVAGLGVSQANAARTDFVPGIEPVPHAIFFDVEGGYYENHSYEIDCGINTISTTIHFDELRPAGRWGPALTIELVNGKAVKNELGNGVVAFQAGTRSRAPKTIFIELLRYNSLSDKGADEIIRFHTTAPSDRPVDIRLEWTSRGLVTLSIYGEESHSVNLGRPVNRINFFGSSAKGDFDPINIGHTPHLDDPGEKSCLIS